MVKYNVDKLSQPSTVWNIYVAESLDAVYVKPSIQVYESQCAPTLSIEVVLLLMIRFKVATLTQPVAFVVVQVAVLLEEV